MALVETGDLKHRLEFYSEKSVQNDNGIRDTVNVLEHTCYCAVRTMYLKDIKTTIGTSLEDSVTFIIRSKQRITITNKLKVKFKGKFYNIVKITQDLQNNEYDTLICKAVS